MFNVCEPAPIRKLAPELDLCRVIQGRTCVHNGHLRLRSPDKRGYGLSRCGQFAVEIAGYLHLVAMTRRHANKVCSGDAVGVNAEGVELSGWPGLCLCQRRVQKDIRRDWR